MNGGTWYWGWGEDVAWLSGTEDAAVAAASEVCIYYVIKALASRPNKCAWINTYSTSEAAAAAAASSVPDSHATF